MMASLSDSTIDVIEERTLPADVSEHVGPEGASLTSASVAVCCEQPEATAHAQTTALLSVAELSS